MENIISMKNVTKYFKENRALKNLTFSIEEGEIFGFLGQVEQEKLLRLNY